MAVLTLAPVGYELRVTIGALDTNAALVFRDQVYELIAVGADEAAKDADAAATAAAFITALGGVTEGDIFGYSLRKKWGTADAVSSVATLHKVAVLTLLSANAGSKNIPHNIIAPADAILTNGKVVNAGHANVGTYLANFMSAGKMRMSDNEAIASSNPVIASRVKTVSSGKTY